MGQLVTMKDSRESRLKVFSKQDTVEFLLGYNEGF